MLCEPDAIGFGVTFGPSAAISPAYQSGHVWQYEAGDVTQYVPGSWLGYWYDGNDLVEVNAADKETVQTVIDSVERVRKVDANGCPVERQEGFTTDSEQMSVCRYDADFQLEQSELLSPEDTAAAIAALEAAPAGDPTKGGGGCSPAGSAHLHVNLMTADLSTLVILQAPCPYKPGITSGGESFQELTSDVLYWALSPGWFGAVEGDVPLPDPLRSLPMPEPAASICPADFPASSSGSTYEIQGVDTSAGPVVCRYELDWEAESGGSYVFDEQRTPTADELDQLKEAVRSAPLEFGGNDCRGGPGELYAVYADGYSFSVFNGECGQSGVLASEEDLAYRDVTTEVLDLLGSPYGLLQ